MKNLLTPIFLFFIVAISIRTAAGSPYAIERIADGQLFANSRNGEHAIIFSGDNTILWARNEKPQKISAPNDSLEATPAAVNNLGQVLFIGNSDTECKVTRRETDGSFTTIADIFPDSSDPGAGLDCIAAFNNLGEAVVLTGFQLTSSVSLYFDDNASLQKISDFSPDDVPLTLLLTDSRLAILTAGDSNPETIVQTFDVSVPSAPITTQKILSDHNSLLDVREDGAFLISAANAELQSTGRAPFRLHTREGTEKLTVTSALFEDDGSVYGQSTPRNFTDLGGGAGAFVRTRRGKFESLNCAVPNSVRYNFFDATARLDDGSILAQLNALDNSRSIVALLHPTGERITQHYCISKLETHYVGQCADTIKSKGIDAIPDGAKCTVSVRVLDYAGMPLKNVSILVNSAPTREQNLTLRTDQNGRAHFTFIVDYDSIFTGAVTVTAPYRNSRIRSSSHTVIEYPDEV